jgi:hypothetical protein
VFNFNIKDNKMKLNVLKKLPLLVVCLLLNACISPEPKTIIEPLKIDKIFFAQQHVLEPHHPYFKLVSNLEALLKVQVYSNQPSKSPSVFAILELGSRRKEISLQGPSVLPKPYIGETELFPHSYDDSFTAAIPKEWVRPGLKVAVELRKADKILDKRILDKIKIGPPNLVKMIMFDFHFFGYDKGIDYPSGWLEELESKLPVSKIELEKVKNISLDTLVMPPRGGKPAVRCSSPEEYTKKCGLRFDGEQSIALQWTGALKSAAGDVGWYVNYFGNIAGVHSGGQAGGFRGVGNLKRQGVLIHELGHSFGLPHWLRYKAYPYRGDMYGIKTDKEETPHVGPPWAFDLKKMEFIPPTVQKDSDRGKKGHWKKDPMQGGGMGDQEDGYMFRHFSAYSVYKIRNNLEKRHSIWDEKTKKYYHWNTDDKAYTTPKTIAGNPPPVKHDLQVYSLMFSTSGATPEANIIYAPIGPYKSGAKKLFDADSPKERKEAEKFGFSETNCNVCIRVTQGRTTKAYLVPISISPKDNPLERRCFHVNAINLPVNNGKITSAELLYTPNLLTKGTEQARVLATWKITE